jgi:tetratricopeptide (TPR) repeat protein
MQQFHILSFPYIAILAGIGVNSVSNTLRKYKEPLMRWASLSALFGILLFMLFTNYHKIASARNLIYKTYGENILKTIDKPTILITGTEESNILYYFNAVEGNKKNDVRLITFSLMQHKWYVDQLKERYTDISFPFEKVIVGKKLDEFYEENLENFSIVFAPLDSQAAQSISNKFSLIPYGVTIALIKSENEPNKEKYVERNKKIFSEFRGKDQILDKTYADEATNETLMAYARAFTNVGLRSNKFGDTQTALFFLDKATEAQPGYYTAYEVAASIYIKENDLAGAAGEYKKILEVNPAHSKSLRNLALIYEQWNNKSIARDYANKYLESAKTQAEKKEAQEILLQISN